MMGGRSTPNDPPKGGRYITGPIADIADERSRQIRQLGYIAENDDIYIKGELALAAAALILAANGHVVAADRYWPSTWRHRDFWDRNRREELVKAGALIAAEIARIDRTFVPSCEPKGGAK